MVESGRGLGEDPFVVGVVAMEGDHESPVGVGEDPSDATAVWYIQDRVNVEDGPVPADARVQIGDGQGEVVQARLDGRHRTSSDMGTQRPAGSNVASRASRAAWSGPTNGGVSGASSTVS